MEPDSKAKEEFKSIDLYFAISRPEPSKIHVITCYFLNALGSLIKKLGIDNLKSIFITLKTFKDFHHLCK